METYYKSFHRFVITIGIIFLFFSLADYMVAGFKGWSSGPSLSKILGWFQDGSSVDSLNISDVFQVNPTSGTANVEGYVGINNSSPGAATANDLVIGTGETAGESHGLTIVAGTSGYNLIYFGRNGIDSGTEDYEGAIRYNQGSRKLEFGSSGVVNRMVLDASGNLGVGTTTPDENFEIEVSANVDIELGDGATDTDITFIKLRSPDGTPYWIYPADGGGGLTIAAAKP